MDAKTNIPYEVFICECNSPEHQLIVRKDNEDNVIYLHVHLIKRGFLRRLIIGIKYIFGHRSIYGEWDEFIFKEEDLKRVKELFINL